MYFSLSVGVQVRTYENKNGLKKTVYEYLGFDDLFRFLTTSVKKQVSFTPPGKLRYLAKKFREENKLATCKKFLSLFTFR